MFKRLASAAIAAGLTISCMAGTVQAAGTTATYTSEITGEPISASLQTQRPIAVMIDNDERSLPHYNVSSADVVYEMVNSTLLNRITRLMCVYKDWDNASLAQIGNIRSARPTNILLASEYNAVLCHDGGPFYNTPYFESTAIDDFSGDAVFSRVSNGKAREFTEYILPGDLDKGFVKMGYSKNYTENVGSHFNFAPYGTEVHLENVYGPACPAANLVTLPFGHSNSMLAYDPTSGLYAYWEYGQPAVDGANGQQIAFKNVIIQFCDFTQYDKNGYLIYNCVGQNKLGYYITNGRAVPIYWNKLTETGKTQYYDVNGNEIQINTGKTYVALVPDDSIATTILQ